MKQTLVLLFTALLIASFRVDAQSLKELIPQNSKVFVLFPENHTNKKVIEKLNTLNYWKIVDNRKDADFIVKMIVVGMGRIVVTEYSAYAEIDDKNNSPIYITKAEVFYESEEAMLKVIRNRIIGALE